MEKLVVFATAAQNRLPKTFKLKFCIASYTKCLYNKSVVVVCFIVFFSGFVTILFLFIAALDMFSACKVECIRRTKPLS